MREQPYLNAPASLLPQRSIITKMQPPKSQGTLSRRCRGMALRQHRGGQSLPLPPSRGLCFAGSPGSSQEPKAWEAL